MKFSLHKICDISGVSIYKNKHFFDKRGKFIESYNKKDFKNYWVKILILFKTVFT